MPNKNNLDVGLKAEAVGLQCIRVVNQTIRKYTPVTFDNPYQGCEVYLRRCLAFGYLEDDGEGYQVDVLDDQGDIIQDFPLTQAGFEYLRGQLKLKWENRGEKDES